MHTSNEITHRHAAASQVIRWLPSAVPRQAKPGTKTWSNTVGKPSVMVKRTVSCHSEVRAFEEAGSLSTTCAASSGSNRVALRSYFHSDKSCQLLVESGNHTQRRERDNYDTVMP
jgi:hypothetical protein